MNPATFQHFSQTAATMAVSSLWQDSVLLAGVWLCLRLAPRTSAALRFQIWSAVFAVMVVLPFLQFLPHSNSTIPAVISSAPARPFLELDRRWSIVILAAWLAVSLYRAADLALHIHYLRRLWKSATQVESTQFNTPRRARICLTEQVQRPSVIGFLAPRILIPSWLYDKLTPTELDQIVLHESQHLRRNDDWTNLLQKLALIFFPLSPALILVERKLCSEREMACDEGVIRITNAPRAYATCLTRLAERNLQHRAEALSAGTLSLGTWQRRSDLVPRIHSILTRKHTLHPAAARTMLTVLVAALIGGSFELSHTPQLITFTAAPNLSVNAQATLDDVQPHPRVRSLRQSTSQVQPTIENVALSTPAAININHRMPVSRPKRQNPAPLQPAPKTAVFQQQAELQNTAAILPAEGTDSEQGWVVLTTWQQSPAALTDQQVRQQMILRKLPQGSFLTPTFAAVPTRNGWLVIQL